MSADLAIIIVSTNEAHWLEPCLSTVFGAAGSASLDVVVVDNNSVDGTRELVEARFPEARVVWSENHGFAHANNRGAVTCDARYVLFLNPDTEIVSGTFGGLVAAMDARPTVGMAGVKQITGDGTLWPTIRYFPSPIRTLSEAFGSERWPVRPRWAGERELDMTRYETEVPCDWTSGSYMLCRTEALLSAGMMDERFFIYSEEPDLCLRMKRAGWDVRHLPAMTIVHHANKAGLRPKMEAQDAYTRLQFARKHMTGTTRAAYVGALVGRQVIRAATAGARSETEQRRAAARAAMAALTGRAQPPFGDPPPTALAHDATAVARGGAEVPA